MQIRTTGATALTLLLLLTSLLDAAGHELLCLDEPAGPGTAVELSIPGERIASGEVEKDHDCPCRGLGGSRISLGSWSTTDPVFVVAEVAAVRDNAVFIEPLLASHPSRGPPR